MTIDWSARDVAASLRAPRESDDKYSRGVLGMRTGSIPYPGSAVLGVEAAWRTGIGMVRYVGPARDLVLARRPETVAVEGRVQAWLIGSGTDAADRSRDETDALRTIVRGDLPVVVDAGALDLAVEATAPMIVTPHAREHDRLRSLLGLEPAESTPESAVETARALGAVVLVKGATTIVATPDGTVLRVRSGVSWLATAGTGDVLAGALGALVAAASVQEASPALAPLAASAAWLHGRAAWFAASALGAAGGPITALDVAEALPRAVGDVLGAR